MFLNSTTFNLARIIISSQLNDSAYKINNNNNAKNSFFYFLITQSLIMFKNGTFVVIRIKKFYMLLRFQKRKEMCRKKWYVGVNYFFIIGIIRYIIN